MSPRRPQRTGVFSGRLAPSITRAVCLMIAAASVVGLYFTAAGSSTAAQADASSAVTLGWSGSTGALAAYQPDRQSTDPEYTEFKNITVTVDQTTAITDQAIQVTVDGFAGTRAAVDSGGATWSSAQNFMQAMQCWGADPKAADFYQTCEWGGRFVNNNGLGNSVYLDNIPRVAYKDLPPTAQNTKDVPFLPVGSTTPVTGRQTIEGTSPDPVYPLLDYFGPSTTNEVQSARINQDGSGIFNFETQDAIQAPPLGCGSPGHTRCWLVLVPRGTVYLGHDNTCSDILDADYNPYTYGRSNSIQAGSPVNPQCGYWNNRMVVPLDFTPTSNSCPVGNTERGTIGSQLLVSAMASWQPQLCKDLATTYTFSTNPDSVARAQLVEGQSGMAFTSFPLNRNEFDQDGDKAAYDTTKVSYAPIAITSADIAFLAEGPGGRITTLNLSPRLVAKLLTQSYRFQVPATTSSTGTNYLHLSAKNYNYLSSDPDFQALNPGNFSQFTTNPAIVIPGPAGADAIRQVWKWIQGDKDAAAFLAGAADPSGMTVNPYYLPSGNAAAIVPSLIPNSSYTLVPCPASRADWAAYQCRKVGLSNADGTPFQLSTASVDTFTKADESLVPITLPEGVTSRFGSLQASPFVDTFLNAARTAFRADPGAKTIWDPTAITGGPTPGDYVTSGPQIQGQRFMIAITDAPSAEKYALTSVGLTLDNSSAVVTPTAATMSAAVSSNLVATTVDSVKQIDPTKAVAGQYPLTTVVYAAVNLSASNTAALKDFSNFIAQVTTKGQTPGTQVGELPPGYVPLTSAMVDQAQAAAVAVKSYTPADTSTNGSATDDYTGSFGSDGGAFSGGSTPAGVGATSSAVPTDAPGRTPGVSGGFSIGQVALGGSLATGLAGAAFAPLLFRGRRIL